MGHRLLQARGRVDIDSIVALCDEILAANADDIRTLQIAARTMTAIEKSDLAADYWNRIHTLAPNNLEAAFRHSKFLCDSGHSLPSALAALGIDTSGTVRKVIEHEIRGPLDHDAASQVIGICGVSFCGSTLLDLVLGSLRGVRGIGESHWLTHSTDVLESHDYVSRPRLNRALSCVTCDLDCVVLTHEFMSKLAANRCHWYPKIAHRLRAGVLVHADKNLDHLVANDPLLRMHALVLFKSPAQAWASALDQLPRGRSESFYLDQLSSYLDTWILNYQLFLDHFEPAGKVMFLPLEKFTTQPDRILDLICRQFDLFGGHDVLDRIRPGHVIAGQRKVWHRVRDAGYKLEIDPLRDPVLEPGQQTRLDACEPAQSIYARMLARFAES